MTSMQRSPTIMTNDDLLQKARNLVGDLEDQPSTVYTRTVFRKTTWAELLTSVGDTCDEALAILPDLIAAFEETIELYTSAQNEIEDLKDEIKQLENEVETLQQASESKP